MHTTDYYTDFSVVKPTFIWYKSYYKIVFRKISFVGYVNCIIKYLLALLLLSGREWCNFILECLVDFTKEPM